MTDQDITTQTERAESSHRPVDDEISLWEVLAVLLRRRGTIVLTTILVSALAVAVTLSRAETFTTSASFRPQGSEASGGQLMALASQFGVNFLLMPLFFYFPSQAKSFLATRWNVG